LLLINSAAGRMNPGEYPLSNLQLTIQLFESPQTRRFTRCLANMLGSGLRPTAGLRSNLPSSFEIHPNGATVFAEPDPPNNAFDHLCGHSCRATGAIRRGPEHVGQSRAARKSRL